ncbi:Unknown protein, partial [Striga hermonthica]
FSRECKQGEAKRAKFFQKLMYDYKYKYKNKFHVKILRHDPNGCSFMRSRAL